MIERFIQENGMVLISVDKFEELVAEAENAREVCVKLREEVKNCERLKQAIMSLCFSEWNLERYTLEDLLNVDAMTFGFNGKVGKLLSAGIALKEMVLFINNTKREYDAQKAQEVSHE